jgi:hypothetical protein
VDSGGLAEVPCGGLISCVSRIRLAVIPGYWSFPFNFKANPFLGLIARIFSTASLA